MKMMMIMMVIIIAVECGNIYTPQERKRYLDDTQLAMSEVVLGFFFRFNELGACWV